MYTIINKTAMVLHYTICINDQINQINLTLAVNPTDVNMLQRCYISFHCSILNLMRNGTVQQI